MWKQSSCTPGPIFSGNCIGSASWRCFCTSGSCWWDISISGRKGRWTGTAQPYAGTALCDGNTRPRKKSGSRKNPRLAPRGDFPINFFPRGVDPGRASRTFASPCRVSCRGWRPRIHVPFRCNRRDRFPIEPRFELNYHLLSMSRRDALRLRVRLPGDDPVIESVVPVWPTANWHEREIFDLFGMRFEGHPDLRRMLMPDDWEGYPLRKD